MISSYRQAAGSLSRARDAVLLLARAVMGVLFIDHGLQKYHAKGGLQSFEYFVRSLKNVPFPALTSHVVPVLEVVGGVLLLAGLLTRVIALLLAAEMAFTGLLVKLHDLHTGVVNPLGAGAEMDFAYLALLVVVLFLGPGRASVDSLIGLEARSQPAASPSLRPAESPAIAR